MNPLPSSHPFPHPISLTTDHAPPGRQSQDWSQRVLLGNMDGYRDKFEAIQEYFKPRFPDATRVGNEMIRTILEKTS